MSTHPMNPLPKINTFGRMISRSINGKEGVKTIVFTPDLDDDTPWTVGYQETGTGHGSLKISLHKNLVTLDHKVNFGKFGGDFFTGIGAFTVELTAESVAGCDVNFFWTLQPYLIDVGEKQDIRQTVATATPTFLGTHDGYVPFPFNAISLFSTFSPYDFSLINSAGDLLEKVTVTSPTTYTQSLLIPPDSRIQVTHTAPANEFFTLLYSRK